MGALDASITPDSCGKAELNIACCIHRFICIVFVLYEGGGHGALVYVNFGEAVYALVRKLPYLYKVPCLNSHERSTVVW